MAPGSGCPCQGTSCAPRPSSFPFPRTVAKPSTMGNCFASAPPEPPPSPDAFLLSISLSTGQRVKVWAVPDDNPPKLQRKVVRTARAKKFSFRVVHHGACATLYSQRSVSDAAAFVMRLISPVVSLWTFSLLVFLSPSSIPAGGQAWCTASGGGQGPGHGTPGATYQVRRELVLLGGGANRRASAANIRVRSQVPGHHRPARQTEALQQHPLGGVQWGGARRGTDWLTSALVDDGREEGASGGRQVLPAVRTGTRL